MVALRRIPGRAISTSVTQPHAAASRAMLPMTGARRRRRRGMAPDGALSAMRRLTWLPVRHGLPWTNDLIYEALT